MSYSVTVYIAAPGTPLANGKTSLPGHMYYVTSDGESKNSYGFAPIEAEHGQMWAQGDTYGNDLENYQNPHYARTMEISKAQYDALNAFGEKPENFGFDLEYNGVTNSCIDFTWKALNHAGLHKQIELDFHAPEFSNITIENKNNEGSLKPMNNIDSIKGIQAPFSESELNQEHFNPMPDRNIWQKLLSENDTQEIEQEAMFLTGDPYFDALVAGLNDPAMEKKATEMLVNSQFGQEFYQEGRDMLAELTQREFLQEQERVKQALTRTPSRSRSIS